MERSIVPAFVISFCRAFARLRAKFPRFFARQIFRGSSSRRVISGFVLLAFAVTQIFYPMVLLAAGRLSPKNTPPDSFLRTQVNSVPDLVSEIQHNLRVRRNYARHFGIPSSQIAGYIRKNLVIRTLRHPYRHIVYCVRPDGVFFYVNQTMPVGTKVFALKQSGRPVLKWACGNPFTKRLPHPDSIVTFLRRSRPKKPTEVTAADVEVITPDEAPAAVVPVEAVAPSTEVIGASPLTPASVIVPAVLLHGGGGSLLPFLPLIPVLFGAGGGGGGSNGGTTGGATTSTGGGTAGGSTSTTGGSTATTGGSTATTGGSTATTGGSTATTGGSTATTGGSTATTGGSTATTGGMTATTGGSTATTGGMTATTGGSTATTGGMTATTGGMTGTTTGGTTASVVPEPGGSSTVGYAFLALAFLAFASSIRRKRKSQE